MKKVLLYILLLALFISFARPSGVFGQMQTDSNEWVTRVGDSPDNVVSNDLVKVALDIKNSL